MHNQQNRRALFVKEADFQKTFHLYGQNETFRGGFINNSLLNLRFAQMSYSIFAQYNESHINPLHLSPLGEGKNEP